MNIFTVKGQSKSGKSTAIKSAIIELVREHGFVLQYNSKGYPNESKEFLLRIKDEFYTPKKYVGQITCIGYFKGCVVCITTYGDSFDYDIEPALNKGIEYKADLFVCASHDTGYEKLCNLAGNDIMMKKKDRSKNLDNRGTDNKLFSNLIVERVIDFCSTIKKGVEQGYHDNNNITND